MSSVIETLGNPILVPKNDHEDATLTSVSSVVADFPAEDTQNTIRDRVYRSANSPGTVTMTWSLPSSRTIDSFFLFRHTLSGASVRLQAGSYDSGTVSADWWTDTDEYTWSAGVDPLISTYPFRLYFDPVTVSSYTITLSGTPTYASYYEISTIVLGHAYQYSQPSVGNGYALSVQDISEKNRSLGGSSRSNVGESWRVAVLELMALQDWERSAWLKFKRYLGTGRAFVWSLYPGQGGDVERDNMGLWKFAQIDPLSWEARHLTQRLQLEEC